MKPLTPFVYPDFTREAAEANVISDDPPAIAVTMPRAISARTFRATAALARARPGQPRPPEAPRTRVLRPLRSVVTFASIVRLF